MGSSFLIKKAYATYKYEGIKSLIVKTKRYVSKKIGKVGKEGSNCYKDILIINGCALPHPARYRVDHQLEQLHFNGSSCDSIYFEDLKMEMVNRYRAFIFFRSPVTDTIENFIRKAKSLNKVTFFDVDDLVIDERYVKDIEYLKSLTKEEHNLYMEGVHRMNRTLRMCDYAITTTAALSNELKQYVQDVFVNRNVASEKMLELSNEALESKGVNGDKVIIGYFSGSITHNDDFKMIIPVLQRMFQKFPHVFLKITGILDIPEDLKPFEQRIIVEQFMDWTKLPKAISSVDINIAPLENSLFNAAKSEIKWIESALVKVPTIASNIGAFNEMIEHEQTGLLCNNNEDWEYWMEKLILDTNFRGQIAERAHQFVKKKCVTAYTGFNLLQFIESKLKENIAFVLPSTQISGGVNVVLKHCKILKAAGKDVFILSMGTEKTGKNLIFEDGEIPVINSGSTAMHAYIHCGVATLWSTVDFVKTYTKIKRKYYLVQGFETDFYKPGHVFRVWANLTYGLYNEYKFITVSQWCRTWLIENYHKDVKYARNGIDLNVFKPVERNFDSKIKILIEGNPNDYFKNVDESFEITNRLDQSKYEIWYLSNSGAPKSWYRIDKFFTNIPNDKVSGIYQSCHILIKSSILESFSYPPLEMMATGGIVIVRPNEGNVEYLKDGVNCLFYKKDDPSHALSLIENVCKDRQLREVLIEGGLKTALERDWNKVHQDVLKLYDIKGEGNEAE